MGAGKVALYLKAIETSIENKKEQLEKFWEKMQMEASTSNVRNSEIKKTHCPLEK